jgi:hypothetical protein
MILILVFPNQILSVIQRSPYMLLCPDISRDHTHLLASGAEAWEDFPEGLVVPRKELHHPVHYVNVSVSEHGGEEGQQAWLGGPAD